MNRYKKMAKTERNDLIMRRFGRKNRVIANNRPVRASRRITASSNTDYYDFLHDNGEFENGEWTKTCAIRSLDTIVAIANRLRTVFDSIDSDAFCDFYECRDSDGDTSNELISYNGIIGSVLEDIDKIYDILDKQFPNGESDVDSYGDDVTNAFDSWIKNVGEDVMYVLNDGQ